MAISRRKKEDLVAAYTELIQHSRGVILTENKGLDVDAITELRSRLREAEGTFRVTKNTLTKLAFKNVGYSVPDELLTGPTVLGFALADMPGVAKAIVDFAKENERLAVKGGLLGGQLLSAEDVKSLAELPPLPVLRAQLLGLINTPAARVASALSGGVRQVVSVVKAYADTHAEAPAA